MRCWSKVLFYVLLKRSKTCAADQKYYFMCYQKGPKRALLIKSIILRVIKKVQNMRCWSKVLFYVLSKRSKTCTADQKYYFMSYQKGPKHALLIKKVQNMRCWSKVLFMCYQKGPKHALLIKSIILCYQKGPKHALLIKSIILCVIKKVQNMRCWSKVLFYVLSKRSKTCAADQKYYFMCYQKGPKHALLIKSIILCYQKGPKHALLIKSIILCVIKKVQNMRCWSKVLFYVLLKRSKTCAADQKFGIGEILMFLKTSLLLIKAAFIWTEKWKMISI